MSYLRLIGRQQEPVDYLPTALDGCMCDCHRTPYENKGHLCCGPWLAFEISRLLSRIGLPETQQSEIAR